MIEINQLSFSYDKENQVIKNINIKIEKGKRIGIIGANGAGKSTLLRLIMGLEKPNSGEIFLDGTKIEKKSLPEIRKKCGYLFQSSENQLFMPTALDDVTFALKNYGMTDNEAKIKGLSVLKDLGVLHLSEKPVWKMSGGEQKLVCIASILANNPEILIMDEPTNGLDPKNRKAIIDTINALDKTKIIASHDLDMILDTCERVILMSQGKIISDGKAYDILHNKDLLERNGLLLPLSVT